MAMPSEPRRPSKNSASLISPRSWRCQESLGESRPASCAGSQPAWAAQVAATLLKSISSTTRPRSNSSASAESGESGEVMPLVYKTRRVPATADRARSARPLSPIVHIVDHLLLLLLEHLVVLHLLVIDHLLGVEHLLKIVLVLLPPDPVVVGGIVDGRGVVVVRP